MKPFTLPPVGEGDPIIEEYVLDGKFSGSTRLDMVGFFGYFFYFKKSLQRRKEVMPSIFLILKVYGPPIWNPMII